MRAFWCAKVLADGLVAENAPVMVPRRQGRSPFWYSAAGIPCILVAALDVGAIMRDISAAAPQKSDSTSDFLSHCPAGNLRIRERDKKSDVLSQEGLRWADLIAVERRLYPS